MFELYQEIAIQYKKPFLKYERELIALAQKGNSLAREEILLHSVGFFLFRIKTTLYPSIVMRDGEDILQDLLYMAIKKIYTYNLRYRNKTGKLQPLHFSTYIWKSTTGLILASVKNRKEICFSDLADIDKSVALRM